MDFQVFILELRPYDSGYFHSFVFNLNASVKKKHHCGQNISFWKKIKLSSVYFALGLRYDVHFFVIISFKWIISFLFLFSKSIPSWFVFWLCLHNKCLGCRYLWCETFKSTDLNIWIWKQASRPIRKWVFSFLQQWISLTISLIS